MRYAPVVLPDLGTGSDVPVVVSYWFTAPGGPVWEGERLVEVLAGPATFDVPSPVSGRLIKIHSREDDRVTPGAVLGLIAPREDDAPGPLLDREQDPHQRPRRARPEELDGGARGPDRPTP